MLMQGSQIETLEVEFLIKPLITSAGMHRLLNMLITSYQDEDHYNMEELVKNLAKEHTLWASHAFEILHVFKNSEAFASILPHLMNRVADRHNRFYLLSHFSHALKNVTSKVYAKMGQAYFFNFWNPTGHY